MKNSLNEAGHLGEKPRSIVDISRLVGMQDGCLPLLLRILPRACQALCL